MLFLKIKNTKNFMSSLFAGSVFNDFYMTECEVHTITDIVISGKRNAAWSKPKDESADSDNKDSNSIKDMNNRTYQFDIFENYCMWRELKEMVYGIIKGNQAPGFMKIVFAYPYEDDKLADSNGGYGTLTIKFEDGFLTLLTSYQYISFSLDKSLNDRWDKMIQYNLDKIGLEYEC